MALTATSTPLTAMEAAYWDYLGAQENYQAHVLGAGVTEFRGYDGRVLPFFEEVVASASVDRAALPAIGSSDWEHDQEGGAGIGWEDRVVFTCRLVFPVDDPQESRARVERAGVTVRDIVRSDDAQRSKLNAAGSISDVNLGAAELRPWRDEDMPAAVLFWEYRWRVELIGTRQFG